MSTEQNHDQEQLAKPKRIRRTAKEVLAAKRLEAEKRAEKAQRRLEKLERKAKIAKTRLTHARKGIPQCLDCDHTTPNISPIVNPIEFHTTSTEDDLRNINLILRETSFNDIVRAAAKVYGCDKNEVCFLERGIIKRPPDQARVIYVRYCYNPDFNDEIKIIEGTKFHTHLKVWTIPEDEVSVLALSKLLSRYFSIVIDLAAAAVLKSSVTPEIGGDTRIAFSMMPFEVEITTKEIIAAISEFKPGDTIELSKLRIHDGVSFKSIDGAVSVFTRMPFLLIRYSGDSQPRYCSFSSLAKKVEDVVYESDIKLKAKYIARYSDTCQHWRENAFNFIGRPEFSSSEDTKLDYHGPFLKFAEDLHLANALINGLRVIPLCSDYVTLTETGYGIDSNRKIIAYACPDQKSVEFLRNIAKFFVPKDYGWPVVFSRSKVEQWNSGSSEFLLTIAHELAHYLTAEKFGLMAPHHGVEWVVYANILEIYYGMEITSNLLTHYEDAHQAQVIIWEELESSLSKTFTENLKMTQCPNVEDIHRIAAESISAIKKRLTKEGIYKLD